MSHLIILGDLSSLDQWRMVTMIRCYRTATVCCCWAFCVFVENLLFSAELSQPPERVQSEQTKLPDETRLPGQKPRAVGLPPESVLPRPRTPAPPVEDSRDDPESLPPESVLPRLAQLEVDTVPDDLLQLTATEDRRPWLSLRIKAPIGLTRSLVFTNDSERLCVGGDDKSVFVYRKFAAEGQPTIWGYERTIRWQIQRGSLGRIHAMAANEDWVAIAGTSAMGEIGNIVFIEPSTGNYGPVLMDSKLGHHHRVTSLDFAPDSTAGLASMDVAGCLLYWSRDTTTGRWSAKQLAFDADTGTSLRPFRFLHPVVMVDEKHVVAPRFAASEAGNPQWDIVKYPVMGGPPTILSGPVRHRQLTTALAADIRTGVVASADYEGGLNLFADGRQFRINGLLPQHFALSLDFIADGKTLLVTSTVPSGKQGSLQVYDVQNPASVTLKRTISLDGMPFVAAARNGDTIATASHGQVSIRGLEVPQSAIAVFNNSIAPFSHVAFSTREQNYSIAVTLDGAATNRVKIFDTRQLQLESKRQLEPANWSDPTRFQGQWKVETREVDGRLRVVLSEGGVVRSHVPDISPHRHTCEYWLGGGGNRPAAVAVGTTGENNIYVFRISESGKCELMREFRGHTGAVTCLGLSTDQRYLVSGAVDRTVRVWPLDASATKRDAQIDRWGATFRVENDELIADSVMPAGPLYLRGVRAGDVITRLRIPKYVNSAVTIEDVDDRPAMLRVLNDHPIDNLLGFEYRRGRTAQTPFQAYSAWPALASLFVSQDDEWAYWTPAGFYDASFEGHRMFGWQVNRGVNRAPDFFLAEQVRKTLERPEMMSNLLTAGNVEEAFRGADLRVPASSQWAIDNQLRTAPRITILSPSPGSRASGGTIPVRVSISVPSGQQIVPPKAFANGVIATQRELVSRSSDGGKTELVYQWQASLPSDPRIAIQVVAATESETVATASVSITNDRPKPARNPILYVAAAAVGKYQDSQIPRLDAVVGDIKQVVKSLKNGARSVYKTQDTPFLEDATRSRWTLAMDNLATRMRREADADDVLVIILSGHGVRDEESGEYYFLPANASFAEVMSRQYDKCISSRDLAKFADIPCRKLVVLDTCHSGAISPLQQRQLKSALRVLQEDMMFTMTASQGHQEAVQSRFARRFAEALQGAADRQTGNNNGTVTLAEVGQYVRAMVMADSADEATVQIPTLGPRDLVQQVNLPITASTIRSAAR